jgi:hypothetical protein
MLSDGVLIVLSAQLTLNRKLGSHLRLITDKQPAPDFSRPLFPAHSELPACVHCRRPAHWDDGRHRGPYVG